MPRPSQEILEFDRLRDLLRLRTTSAVGRRAITLLEFRTDRAQLEHEFAAIAEAVAYLRTIGDMGFGALADPEPWLERLGLPGAVLAPAELLDAASLADTTAWLRELLREAKGKFPLLAGRAASLADFRQLAAAIRRAVLPNGEISDNASPELRRIRGGMAHTRETIQKTLERILEHVGKRASEQAGSRPAKTTLPGETTAS